MPEIDLRQVNRGEWRFSLCVIISDPDYIKKSRDFQLNKMTKGRLFRGAARPNTGMGHTYVRFESPGITGSSRQGSTAASRDHLSFGMMATGITSPDGEAGKNSLLAEVATDYVISNAEKNAVCETIGLWLLGHLTADPQYRYDLMSSNCTRFGRECCDAAGIHFPGKRLPSKTSAGWNRTDTPGMLYEALHKSDFAYDPIRERSPGVCPKGFVGFHRAKAPAADARRKRETSLYGLRVKLLEFKEEFPEIKSEPDAVKLMAMVAENTLSKDDLRQYFDAGLQTREIFRALSMLSPRLLGD
ncbi:MAG: hypothetical protein KJO06_05345 [Gemmatimonadetes bacterium]|nr:hypothetical protein [Gemmatimonadota bacterium]